MLFSFRLCYVFGSGAAESGYVTLGYPQTVKVKNRAEASLFGTKRVLIPTREH